MAMSVRVGYTFLGKKLVGDGQIFCSYNDWENMWECGET